MQPRFQMLRDIVRFNKEASEVLRTVSVAGEMTVGTLTAFLTFMTILQMPVRQLGLLVNSFARTSTCGARIFALLDLKPVVSDVKNAPDYRVRLDSEDGPDAGPAWKDSSENAGELVSMRLEGPIFPFPIRAKLFQSNDDPSVWTLRWKHARKIEDEE